MLMQDLEAEIFMFVLENQLYDAGANPTRHAPTAHDGPSAATRNVAQMARCESLLASSSTILCQVMILSRDQDMYHAEFTATEC